jgi:hypothetical protein
MLKYLSMPSRFHFPLTANAGNTTIQVSTADAAIIEQLRLACGGTIRMLIYKPTTYTSTTTYFETVLLTATHTAGVYTVAAMTNEAQYTTALGAKITANLIYDGSCDNWGAI